MRPALTTILLLIVTHTFSFADELSVYTTEVDVPKFTKEAILTYKTTFTLNTTLNRWNRVLDSPVLMCRIWNMYDFSPAYMISLLDTAIHVVDPSGIEGNLYLIQPGSTNRMYLGIGRLKNWLPVTILGRVLFSLTYVPSGDHVDMTFTAYGERSSNVPENLMVKAFSPILINLVNKRIQSNLRDLKIILSDMKNNPEKIRSRLDRKLLGDYNRLLGEKTMAPPIQFMGNNTLTEAKRRQMNAFITNDWRRSRYIPLPPAP
ncbi:MAG: hypothetical protein Q8O92_09460 [Candidatus Latescibacter sp.]|nr:hypothetical protein [Candidatus Latescibacter sp.]